MRVPVLFYDYETALENGVRREPMKVIRDFGIHYVFAIHNKRKKRVELWGCLSTPEGMPDEFMISLEANPWKHMSEREGNINKKQAKYLIKHWEVIRSNYNKRQRKRQHVSER